jgi:hypothetical protein
MDQEKTLASIDKAMTKLRLSETYADRRKATYELMELLQMIQEEVVTALLFNRRPGDQLPQ